ncbi:MAG TPA: VC0807 family protein [Acidimicrobiales bacterium]|nr:VC0807 family protein [Acidimicrobiales bacterium]
MQDAARPAASGDEFPRDPRDGWEPGPPDIRAFLPSAIGGAIIPIAVYFAVRPHVRSDAVALILAGVPAAAWVVIEWLRKRTMDPIGLIVLLGFAVGVGASYSLGGNAFVLKARDSLFTFAFGIACLVSLVVGSRPLMFRLGRVLSAGDDPGRREVFDRLWDLPASRAVFRALTFMWGVGLVLDALARVLLAALLPTSRFVVISPIVAATFVGSMFVATIWFIRWSRDRAAGAMVVDVPEGPEQDVSLS